MIRWFRSLFAWREVRNSGVWSYFENDVTGRRKAQRISGSYQPLDFDWLNEPMSHPVVDGRPAWRSAQGQKHTPYFL